MTSPLDTIHRRPLSQPTIDAIFYAALEIHAWPIEVHWLGRIHEIGIWQHGEWIGSVFRWTDGGLGAWCSIGSQCLQASEPRIAVRRALYGTAEGQLQKPYRRAYVTKRLRWMPSVEEEEMAPTVVCGSGEPQECVGVTLT